MFLGLGKAYSCDKTTSVSQSAARHLSSTQKPSRIKVAFVCPLRNHGGSACRKHYVGVSTTLLVSGSYQRQLTSFLDCRRTCLAH